MRKPTTIGSLALSGYDDIFGSNANDPTGESIVELPIADLHPPEFHPFLVQDDLAMARLVKSIEQYLFDSNIPSPDDYSNGYDFSGMAWDVANIDNNTNGMKDITEENLKYWRDIAERETINRFTTAEVHVDFGGVTNTVNSSMDLDGVIDYLSEGVREAIEVTAEGVYE